MKIQNNTKTTYTHEDLKLLPDGAITEVNDEKVANIWLKIDGIVEYVEPKDVKQQIKELEDIIKELREENNELKRKLGYDMRVEGKPSLEALKREADELGITYAKNIGYEKLIAKIKDAKSDQTDNQ